MAFLAVILLTFIGVIYLFFKHLYSFWSRHGFKQAPSSFPFGSLADGLMLRKSVAENMADIYFSTDEPYIGMHMVFRPTLLVRDPDILKLIMVKDFDHFVDRGFYANEKDDPLSAHVLAMSGKEWKSMRQKMTQALTSGKLKHMMPQFVQITNRLCVYIDHLCENSKNVFDVRELLARYTTDVIASVAFGLEIDSINNEKEMFREIGLKAASPDISGALRFAMVFMAPEVLGFFKIKSIPHDVEKFMMSVVGQTIHHREMTGEKREDFLQLMIQLRNSGKVNEDGDWDTKVTGEEDKKLTIGQICAQAFVFFFAGFETTSTMMSYLIFELAKNKEVQRRLQKEVDEVLAKHNNEITYENIKEMKYLEMCVEETLRMHPSAPIFMRKCIKEYPIPGTNLKIPKDSALMVCLNALQNDPKYFKDPSKFDPDRFSPENRSKIIPFTYMPFGDGPRNCIGMRLSVFQSRVALASMFSKYDFDLAPTQSRDVKIDPRSGFLGVLGGIHLTAKKRN